MIASKFQQKSENVIGVNTKFMYQDKIYSKQMAY